MSNTRITDNKWHDIRYHDLPTWVKRRVKELNHRTLTGKTFIYRRNISTGNYQRRLVHHPPQTILSAKPQVIRVKRFREMISKMIFSFFAFLATIPIILSGPAIIIAIILAVVLVIVGGNGYYVPLKNNPDATNPTWSELESFLASDNTDKLKYNIDTFNCGHFAEMVHNNAEAAGIKAAIVFVQLGPCEGYPTSGPHTLNAFQTTDKGLVYIDCTGTIEDYDDSADKIVDVEIGKPYIPESIFPDGFRYWPSMGVVEEIKAIQW